MLTHLELKDMAEWKLIGEALGELFAEHTQKAISEEKDIGEVRYHKGWVDAINEMIDMLERLFPVPGEQPDVTEDDRLIGDSIITRRTDGSVY